MVLAFRGIFVTGRYESGLAGAAEAAWFDLIGELPFLGDFLIEELLLKVLNRLVLVPLLPGDPDWLLF